MKKKDFIFILGLTLFMAVLWISGELVMGLWIPVVPAVRIIWLVSIVVVTLGVSIWHVMIEDNSDKQDPKRAKYERKVQKRRKK